MRIIIDIGHPAHVHLFRNLALEMQQKGHALLFTCRSRTHVIELLEHYGFQYKCFGNQYKTSIGKIAGLLEFDIKSLITGIGFRPDIFLSHGSMYAAHAAFLLRKPHISLEDTYNFEQIRLYKPFTKAILTSDYDHPLRSSKLVKYAGYHELAYLHPNRFTPDQSVLEELGLKTNQPYVIMRFVAWQATHDKGHTGISVENKIKAVKAFSEYARVFISSESALPDELEPYKINIEPYRMHDAIAFSSLVFGESSTMAEEAAMLGVPSIFVYNSGTIYTRHLEQEYNLVFNYYESAEDQNKSIKKGVEILRNPDLRNEWQIKKSRMLSEKIDVTAFLLWFIENWPGSLRVMKEDPGFVERFKNMERGEW